MAATSHGRRKRHRPYPTAATSVTSTAWDTSGQTGTRPRSRTAPRTANGWTNQNAANDQGKIQRGRSSAWPCSGRNTSHTRPTRAATTTGTRSMLRRTYRRPRRRSSTPRTDSSPSGNGRAWPDTQLPRARPSYASCLLAPASTELKLSVSTTGCSNVSRLRTTHGETRAPATRATRPRPRIFSRVGRPAGRVIGRTTKGSRRTASARVRTVSPRATPTRSVRHRDGEDHHR